MIDINELTLKQIKELQSLTEKIASKSTLFESAIGKYVIVRSRNEGVNAGYLEAADETGCIIREARRLWSHKPKKEKAAWYEGVSLYGILEESKVSEPALKKFIVEDYSLTLCSEEAEKSIKEVEAHPGD